MDRFISEDINFLDYIKAYHSCLALMQRTAVKEPDIAEFISALAAGNNAQLIVIACTTPVDSSNILAALDAAAQQTGGMVICILPPPTTTFHERELENDDDDVGRHVEFVNGDAERLVMEEYREADCILVDCKLQNCQEILEAVLKIGKENVSVMAYNARHMGSWRCHEGFKNAHFLPIGEGLLVAKIDGKEKKNSRNFAVYNGKKNRWLAKIDKYTGEEHVFRV